MPDSTDRPTIQSKVREVLVDVVVTDSKGEPVSGLKKEYFEVMEDNKPETIHSFEEHGGAPVAVPMLPPHVFSNAPATETADTSNVLVLDALNTELADQSQVRAQILRFIKNVQPGTRLAIFALPSRLRFIQGFTSDTSVLLAALENKKIGTGTQSSPVARTGGQDSAEQQSVTQMQQLAAEVQSESVRASVEALKEFLAENATSQTDQRVAYTLQALQQLGRYLAGVPGRKNVIWFTSSFPIMIWGEHQRQYESEIKRTADLLTAARVAVYPIGAEGLVIGSGDDASRNYRRDATLSLGQQQSHEMQTATTARNGNHDSMDEVAQDTGGAAFYNTNGIGDALARVLKHGTRYYTLTYIPDNKTPDGGYRKIRVNVRKGNYTLAYRRGYYDEVSQQEQAKPHLISDPLRPLMDHGTPESSQVLYQIKVLPSVHQPVSDADRAGDNANLKGALTRYTVSFTVMPDNLTLPLTPDGTRRGSLEMALVSYDRDGQTLNWIVRAIELKLTAERYAAAQQGGIPVNLELNIPERGIYLRSGVYDLASSKAGTLEIPLSATSIAAK